MGLRDKLTHTIEGCEEDSLALVAGDRFLVHQRAKKHGGVAPFLLCLGDAIYYDQLRTLSLPKGQATATDLSKREKKSFSCKKCAPVNRAR